MKTIEERAQEFIKKFHDKICMGHSEEIKKALILFGKEQDKITRHACAENVLTIKEKMISQNKYWVAQDQAYSVIMSKKMV
jgi:hypothetical protein